MTQLWAATSSECAKLNGAVRLNLSIAARIFEVIDDVLAPQFLKPWAKVARPPSKTQDEKVGKELWTWLEEQVEGV